MMDNKLFVKVLFAVFSAATLFQNESKAYYDDDRYKDKWLNFNVVCRYYKDKDKDGPKHPVTNEYSKCEAVSQFLKVVDKCGDEVEDRSGPSNNPVYEIKCDDRVIFKGYAHRYTDEHGTRIQAESNAFPATTLPCDSLKDDHKYVRSYLELGDQSLSGYCYIYTGPALFSELD